MPGNYNYETRTITLETDPDQDRVLTHTSLVNHVVRDLLHQERFGFANYPELVDLAVVLTGLGVAQSHLGFVNQEGRFWDSTRWLEYPHPFLNDQSYPYALALAAWWRGDANDDWVSEISRDMKRPMQKSLKYLQKTGDSFFQPALRAKVLDQSQQDWIALSNSPSISNQIVAVRLLQTTDDSNEQAQVLVEKLRSSNETVLLHAIASTEQIEDYDESRFRPITDELQRLTEEGNDEIRAKAMLNLVRHGQMDDELIGTAARMLDSGTKHVVYAGLLALTSLPTAPEGIIRSFNRGFMRSLQSCDYEFVGIYSMAINRWYENAEDHLQDMLQEDSPEYLDMAMEALENVREQLVEQG